MQYVTQFKRQYVDWLVIEVVSIVHAAATWYMSERSEERSGERRK